jgi:hypothetical protein
LARESKTKNGLRETTRIVHGPSVSLYGRSQD